MTLKILDSIKGKLLSYFGEYHCPDRFSLTSETEKQNFYEVHVFLPKAKNSEIVGLSKKQRGMLRVDHDFVPSKQRSGNPQIISGRRSISGIPNFEDYELPIERLRYARIDVTYFYSGWVKSKQDCSIKGLIWFYTLRKYKLGIFSKFTWIFQRRIKNILVSRRLKNPIKSKYEIYEVLMADENIISKGNFSKTELSKKLFGDDATIDYKIYKKVSNSLDWILEACIEDNEIQKIGNSNDFDGAKYKITGKGIHYFTLTKTQIENEENNKRIQKSQTRIQYLMVIFTFFLVIGTFWSNVGIEKMEAFTEILKSLIILSILNMLF